RTGSDAQGIQGTGQERGRESIQAPGQRACRGAQELHPPPRLQPLETGMSKNKYDLGTTYHGDPDGPQPVDEHPEDDDPVPTDPQLLKDMLGFDPAELWAEETAAAAEKRKAAAKKARGKRH